MGFWDTFKRMQWGQILPNTAVEDKSAQKELIEKAVEARSNYWKESDWTEKDEYLYQKIQRGEIKYPICLDGRFFMCSYKCNKCGKSFMNAYTTSGGELSFFNRRKKTLGLSHSSVCNCPECRKKNVDCPECKSKNVDLCNMQLIGMS